MVYVIKRGMTLKQINAIWQKVAVRSTRTKKKVDVYKYLGVLKLEEDPVLLQRKWRDEWK